MKLMPALKDLEAETVWHTEGCIDLLRPCNGLPEGNDREDIILCAALHK